EHGRQVVPAKIVHQRRELIVTPPFDQSADVALVADFVIQSLAPGLATSEHQGRIKLVRAIVDPAAQRLSARLVESRLLKRAIFQNDNVPAEVLEKLFVAGPKALAHDRIEALTVVVDDPPTIAQSLFPPFQQRLENIAFVEFGIADERDHAAFRPVEAPTMRADVILRER